MLLKVGTKCRRNLSFEAESGTPDALQPGSPRPAQPGPVAWAAPGGAAPYPCRRWVIASFHSDGHHSRPQTSPTAGG